MAFTAPATDALTAVMKTSGGEALLLPLEVPRKPTAELMEAPLPNGIIDIDEAGKAFRTTVADNGLLVMVLLLLLLLLLLGRSIAVAVAVVVDNSFG